MRFLIIGDIVGSSGLKKLKVEYQKLVEEYKIDFSIVNGENSANGKGLRMQEYNEIIDLGVDAITMGNHIYYRKEMAEQYSKLPRLLIPSNITNLIGNGSIIVEKQGKKIGVINIIGRVGMGEIAESHISSPFQAAKNEVEKLTENLVDYIFVDFHAEATAEKIAMGYYLENSVNCVFGTHTHVQTSDETILDSGMAYITDVGMTGPKGSVLGLKKELALKRFLTGEYVKYECSQNEAMLSGIFVEIDDTTKRAIKIERINR
ncbi:MAG: TIGR00282 family metallophosphoesterase [Clostridia bacterium]|nr:TIGR00282 family metallophosphoesterase [Clostridia bacterium]